MARTIEQKPGTVGLTVVNIDGQLRVVTADGAPVCGVTSFNLSAGINGGFVLSVTVLCSKLEGLDP